MRKSYIHTDLRYAAFDDFEGPLEDYNLDNKDKKRVMKWLENKKKKN